MADLLRPIPIADLKHLEGGKAWSFDQPIAGLDALTPVRGHVHVQHQGPLLAVKGHAETLVSLCCDRCLRPFNHPLSMHTDEVLGLGEATKLEGLDLEAMDLEAIGLEGVDLDTNGLDASVCETLDPRGSFDPERWVFEQLSLQWPLVTLCGSDCPGPECWSSQAASIDPRWAALGQIEL